MDIEVVGGSHMPYPPELVDTILKNTRPASSAVDEITRLNVRLGQIYSKVVADAVEATDTPDGLDLIGSHGQTVYHLPESTPFCGQRVASTLQLGDISTIANLTGIPVVGNFRMADMALGGEGAPLVPYFDYVYFTHSTKSRLLLNIGGISNVTYLPASGARHQVRAFDTGPGNMLIDALMQHLYDEPLDRDGRRAERGDVCGQLLEELVDMDAFLAASPPKSTGREHYGSEFMDWLIERADASNCEGDDLVATVTAFTARTVYDAYRRFIVPTGGVDEVMVSGGGVHNPVLMETLTRMFAPIPVITSAHYGLDPDRKEALCFAVLAHEYINEVPTNIPAVTGAERKTLLGQLALPAPNE